MNNPDQATHELCSGCVYYPPNLPSHAYATPDWVELQARACAFDHTPGTVNCMTSRKTSCSLLDLEATSHLVGPRT
jgi:hypothetical protein